MDNPDQEYVDKYINDMNLMKNRLMERRRTLQQKVEQEEKARENPLSAAYNAATTFSNYAQRLNEAPGPSTSRVSDSVSDIVKAAIENSDVGLKKKQVEFEKSWNSVEKEPETEIPGDNISAGNVRPKQPAGSATFLPSSSSTSGRKDSLPGLGDGKDPDIIETDKPNEIITEADRARIASLVGDSDEDDIGAGPAKKSRPSDQGYSGLPPFQPVEPRNIEQNSRVSRPEYQEQPRRGHEQPQRGHEQPQRGQRPENYQQHPSHSDYQHPGSYGHQNRLDDAYSHQRVPPHQPHHQEYPRPP